LSNVDVRGLRAKHRCWDAIKEQGSLVNEAALYSVGLQTPILQMPEDSISGVAKGLQ